MLLLISDKVSKYVCSCRVEFLQLALGAHVGLLIWTVLLLFLNPPLAGWCVCTEGPGQG